ncbi:MAG: exodeoxyribonuclease VII large subunit, partial [Clostridia bacterium]|nr:exodeoxyribonuclease VII large subunit [Clostridia bacterium]
IADFVADLRAPTPSAAAEIAVPSMLELINRINTDKNRISQNILKRIENNRLVLKRFKMRTPKDRIDDYNLKVDSLVKAMDNCLKMKTMSLKKQLAENAGKLDALSPLQTLSRGYSIPTDSDGNVIRSASDMKTGTEFTLRMRDGQAECVVKGE